MQPSVTQVLKYYIDFSHVAPDILQAAADRGTQVHTICAAIAQDLWIPSIPTNLKGYIKSFENWYKSYVTELVFTEKRLYSKQRGYHGKPDMVVRIKCDKGLSLCDLKTPVTVQKIWRLQLAGYRELLIENGIDINRVFSLRLDKDGKSPKLTEYTESSYDFAIFLSCLNIFKFLND